MARSDLRQGDTHDLERRLVIARALAAEHGGPLAFHDEEDQRDWDRKAQDVLRELDALGTPELEAYRREARRERAADRASDAY